jgi:hypothetical protein
MSLAHLQLNALHGSIILAMARIFNQEKRYATVQDIMAAAQSAGVNDQAQIGQAVEFLVNNQVMVQPDPAGQPGTFALYQPALDQAAQWEQQLAAQQQAPAAPAAPQAPTPQAAPPAAGSAKGGSTKAPAAAPQAQAAQTGGNGGGEELVPGISKKAPRIIEGIIRADLLTIPQLIERIKIWEAGAIANRDAGQALVAEGLARTAARARKTLGKKVKEAQAAQQPQQQAAPAAAPAAVPFTFPTA